MKIIVVSRSRVVRMWDELYIPSEVATIANSRKGKRNRWVAIVLEHAVSGAMDATPTMYNNVRDDGKSKIVTSDGWNGSFHDAHWQPFTVAFASTPAKAKRKLQQVEYRVKEDDSVRRFKVRNAVRPGD